MKPMNDQTIENPAEPTAEEKVKSLGEKCAILIDAITTVIKGCRSGSIRSQPIMEMKEDATEYRMLSLEETMWEALNACGIHEKKAEPKKKKGAQ